jgi:hypothetical protein
VREFGVDVQAVEATAKELTEIRSTLAALGDIGGEGGVTGSPRVQRALENFVADSSDARKKLDSELERAAGLLNGLAAGATSLDSSLAQAITVEGSTEVVQHRSDGASDAVQHSSGGPR